MEYKKIKLSKIKMADYNPRKISETELEKLKRSIQEFGYIQPLIYNKSTRNVVGGNQRLKVLRSLGYDEIEAIEVDLTLEKEKALNLALNKISGEWDDGLLKNILNELNTDDQLLTGFDSDEIDDICSFDVYDLDEILEEHDTKDIITKPIWITARASEAEKNIFEKAKRLLEEHGIKVEVSYES